MKNLLNKKIIWIMMIVILLTAGHMRNRPASLSKSINIGIVKRGELVQRVTIAGSVVPNHKTVISAPYNGYVRKIYVQIGDHVKAGDSIVSMAQSLRGSAEEVFPMRAPFAGVVVQVLKTEGEYVDSGSSGNNGKSLVRIDDLSELFVEASSPEIEVNKLNVGQEATIKASAILGKSYHGKIEHISLAAKDQSDWDKSRIEFPVRLHITDPDHALEPGMSVVVDIITHKLEGVLTLRHEFVQQEENRFFITNDHNEKKYITIGVQNDEDVEIKSGVSEGEKAQQIDFLSTVKGT